MGTDGHGTIKTSTAWERCKETLGKSQNKVFPTSSSEGPLLSLKNVLQQLNSKVTPNSLCGEVNLGLEQ